MNLRNKKELSARTIGVGKERIVFVEDRKDEIKEMITKQDVRDLVKSGAILVKEIKGRKRAKEGKKRRGTGKIKQTVNKRKSEYVIMTRKLRKYLREMMKTGKINKEELKDLRKKIRNKMFKSKANFKSYVEELNK